MEFLSLLDLLYKYGCSPKGHDVWGWDLRTIETFVSSHFMRRSHAAGAGRLSDLEF